MHAYGRDELGTKPAGARRLARGPKALLAFCACVMGVLSALPVHADDVGVSVLPPSVEVNLAPEGVASRELTVANFVLHPVRVDVSTGDYDGAGPGLSAAEWVQVRPAQFLLGGEGEITVTVAIQAPAGIQASGGRYAALVFDAQSVDPLQDVGATTARTDVPIIVNVEATGLLSRLAEVEWFVPVLEPDGRLSFRARLVNTGNVHLVAGGTVQASGSGGQILRRG